MTRRCVAVAVVVAACVTAAACSAGSRFERMKSQERSDVYEASAVFPRGMVMQPPPAGVVARPGMEPRATSMEMLQLGQRQFTVYCAACHGRLGDGDTPVAAHMAIRQPPSLITGRVRQMTPQRIYEAITTGYGLMPSYAFQLSDRERRAVVAYVGALQLSQSADLASLPPDVRTEARAALDRGQP